MATEVRVRYFEAAEWEVAASADLREHMQRVGDRVAADARSNAPVGHPSQGGAAGIDAVTELTPRGWEARISWQQRNYYMKFSESGTVHMPARPFLVPALDRVLGV